MHYNGQPVWFVAVRVRAGEFFAGPGKRYGVFMSRYNFLSGAAKNLTACALAGSPTVIVSVAGFVTAHKVL